MLTVLLPQKRAVLCLREIGPEGLDELHLKGRQTKLTYAILPLHNTCFQKRTNPPTPTLEGRCCNSSRAYPRTANANVIEKNQRRPSVARQNEPAVLPRELLGSEDHIKKA